MKTAKVEPVEERETLLKDYKQPSSGLKQFICSLRTAIISLCVWLSVGTLVVVFVLSAMNVTSLLQMKGKIEDNAIMAVKDFVAEELRAPKIYGEQILNGVKSGVLGSDGM
jgi:hypothetical protein